MTSMHGFLAWLSTWLCPHCSQWQSVLQPDGPAASRLDWLLWVFIGVCGAIWLLVMLVLAVAIWRRHKPDRPPLERDAGQERASAIIVGIAVAATVLIIGGLTFLSYAATRPISGEADDTLVVRLRGYQWWWQVTYANPDPARTFQTANEIHIPVGKPVRFELSAADVIHSFWVPNLVGKQDLIPGRNNQITLIADHPGLYRGQCAQFCGLQHAHMALLVIAEDPAAFEAWRNGQLQQAQSSDDPDAAKGPAVRHLARLRRLPYRTRHLGRRHARAGSHACRRPADHRRRVAADNARLPRGLDRGPADNQTGEQHADGADERGRCDRRSPPIWRR